MGTLMYNFEPREQLLYNSSFEEEISRYETINNWVFSANSSRKAGAIYSNFYALIPSLGSIYQKILINTPSRSTATFSFLAKSSELTSILVEVFINDSLVKSKNIKVQAFNEWDINYFTFKIPEGGKVVKIKLATTVGTANIDNAKLEISKSPSRWSPFSGETLSFTVPNEFYVSDQVLTDSTLNLTDLSKVIPTTQTPSGGGSGGAGANDSKLAADKSAYSKYREYIDCLRKNIKEETDEAVNKKNKKKNKEECRKKIANKNRAELNEGKKSPNNPTKKRMGMSKAATKLAAAKRADEKRFHSRADHYAFLKISNDILIEYLRIEDKIIRDLMGL